MLQNLNLNQPIVDPKTGCPTPYFMQLIQNRGGLQSDTETRLEVVEANYVPKSRLINTTSPLQGGGNLGADLTLTFRDVVATHLLGRGSAAGDGVPNDITVGGGLQLVGTTLSCTVVGITDGDKGDVVISGSGTVYTIDTKAVTLAKMADVATATVFYRKTAGAGAPEVQTLATLKTDLGLVGSNTGDQTITLTGDVTGSGASSFAAIIGANKVTYAKMQQASAASIILGRRSGSAGNIEELTLGTGVIIESTVLRFCGSVINTQAGTTYTAVIGDADGYIRFTNAGAIAFTVPANASVAYRVGTVLTIRQGGAGTVTITPDTGVTLNSFGGSLTTAGQHATVQMKQVAVDVWDVIGHVT